MRPYFSKIFIFLLSATVFCGWTAAGQNLDEIGVTLLRVMTTNLDGSGIRVAQPEAEVATNPPAWEINPANVGQPESLFSYFFTNGSTNVYPNDLGTNSWHAESVGDNFYSPAAGVATNVAHVDNYEGDYFFNDVINATLATNINDAVANQSFVFTGISVSVQQQVDSAYDNYTAQFNTLFVSGAGNGGNVSAPATCYNGIGVGVSDGSSSYGPTLDNGRCKPDLVAPGGATSFSTPYVSGAAALLMQAALRGDGGGDTASAANLRTIKALLLNGAVKPAGWTNGSSTPLDARYGAGILNVFNAYEELAGGKHGYVAATSVATGGAHPPNGAAGTIGTLSGWDCNTNTSSPSSDEVYHYYFNATNAMAYAATATLTWNRHQNTTGINRLALFLFNAANSNLVACSTSLVDNVQHVFVPRLSPGRYDLQVWKAGGVPGLQIVSTTEPYALAWAFVAPELSLAKSGGNAALSWPVYPAGYAVEATTNLTTPAWSTANLPTASFATGTNVMEVPATNPAVFFRLSAQGG